MCRTEQGWCSRVNRGRLVMGQEMTCQGVGMEDLIESTEFDQL